MSVRGNKGSLPTVFISCVSTAVSSASSNKLTYPHFRFQLVKHPTINPPPPTPQQQLDLQCDGCAAQQTQIGRPWQLGGSCCSCCCLKHSSWLFYTKLKATEREISKNSEIREGDTNCITCWKLVTDCFTYCFTCSKYNTFFTYSRHVTVLPVINMLLSYLW